MKFPIIRDFPGHHSKTGVSKSKLGATCTSGPIPLQLWSSSISGLSQQEGGLDATATKQKLAINIVHDRGEVKCSEVSGGRL